MNCITIDDNPLTLARLLSAVNFAKKISENRRAKKEVSDILFVKADGQWNKLDAEEIKYLQAMGDYVRIFTAKGSYMVNKTMKALTESLPKDKFCRIHRSYIVNIRHIDNIKDNSIVIGRDVIPISEGFKARFMQQLNLL